MGGVAPGKQGRHGGRAPEIATARGLRFCAQLALFALGCLVLGTARLPAASDLHPTQPGLSSAIGGTVAGEEIKPADVATDYRISPADIVMITVFQEQDLKSTLRVSNEGTIVFPLIGVVPVGGLTPQQAAHAVRDRLAKGYLVNPQVTLTVMEFSKRRFTVLGEVQKPGSYDLPDQQEITVLQAIGMAGGYTRIANPSKVTVLRHEGGKEKTFALNAKKMASGAGESAFAVVPGDVITVAESRF